MLPSIRMLVCWGTLVTGLRAAEEAPQQNLLLPPLAPGLTEGVSNSSHAQWNGETPTIVPIGDSTTLTKPANTRRPQASEAALTVQRRRWQNLAAASEQPSLWSWKGDVAMEFSAGLQTELFFSDNLAFAPTNLAHAGTVLEVSPILRLDLGDPLEGVVASALPSKYHAGLLYVPTLHHLFEADSIRYLHHLFSAASWRTGLTRLALHFDYDERISTSAEATSPEESYSLLEAAGLIEHQLSPKTLARTKTAYREISTESGLTNRVVWLGQADLEWTATAKTTVGLGSELGHILFEGSNHDKQDYQQALLSWRWQSSAKLSVLLRAGPERREFDTAVPQASRVSGVGAAALQWQASARTRLSLRARVANEPSIVQSGVLFRELRFGPELYHEFSEHWFASSDLQAVRRDYDHGPLEWERAARVSLGYRTNSDQPSNHLTIEAFVQWRDRQRKEVHDNADRSQIGMQITRYF